MPEYGYMLSEHDPERPWLVIGREHRTVTLDDGENFFEWARQEWRPSPGGASSLIPGSSALAGIDWLASLWRFSVAARSRDAGLSAGRPGGI
jgi:hypothetical protein